MGKVKMLVIMKQRVQIVEVAQEALWRNEWCVKCDGNISDKYRMQLL